MPSDLEHHRPAAEEAVRTFVPVPVGERPTRHRRTARVLMVDHDDRLLLFRDSDPGVPGSGWWITPGGGIEPGETDRAAAVRELAEETGAAITAGDLVGPIAARRVVHGYSDVIVDQQETFFGVRLPGFQVDTAGHTEEERLTMTVHHWWTRAELSTTAEIVWPTGILDLWQELTARVADPGRPTLELGTAEESSVVDNARGHDEGSNSSRAHPRGQPAD